MLIAYLYNIFFILFIPIDPLQGGGWLPAITHITALCLRYVCHCLSLATAKVANANRPEFFCRTARNLWRSDKYGLATHTAAYTVGEKVKSVLPFCSIINTVRH